MMPLHIPHFHWLPGKVNHPLWAFDVNGVGHLLPARRWGKTVGFVTAVNVSEPTLGKWPVKTSFLCRASANT